MLTHHRAAVLSVGDELVLGQSLDTNARWLSAQLIERGIPVFEHATVADDLDAILRALQRLCGAAPLVIVTGGLGPTADDLTRQALASLLHEPLVPDEAALEVLSSWLATRGRGMSENQRLQIMRPASARMIPNPVGTAPGMAATRSTQSSECEVYCLPGPPREMCPMFEVSVVPLLRPPAGRVILTRVLRTFGVGESEIAQRLGPLMDRTRNPLIGTTASGGEVTVRIRYEGEPVAGPRLVDDSEQLVRQAIGEVIYGSGDETIQESVATLLDARRERLITAESCTGGLLGSMITSVAGSSAVYEGGWVTYANEVKSRELGVQAALIEEHGAVSAEVAASMAAGALAHAHGAHHALAITGIAGPDGGTPDKPVGTVFVARSARQRNGPHALAFPPLDVRRFHFIGSRTDVRDRSAKSALAMLRLALVGSPDMALLGQVRLDGSPIPTCPIPT